MEALEGVEVAEVAEFQPAERRERDGTQEDDLQMTFMVRYQVERHAVAVEK